MANILLGVTGSVAIYKTCDLVRNLTKAGHSVDVVMSENATKLISPVLFENLTGRKVHVKMFERIETEKVLHVSLSQRADLAIVAPATANIIGKMANGLADDMLSATFMALPKTTPKLIAPAMNTAMWENPAVQRNIQTLCNDGFIILEPREAMLACDVQGKGAMETVEKILEKINEILDRSKNKVNS